MMVKRELHPTPLSSVSFSDSPRTMTVSEFEAYRCHQTYDSTGVYVLHNERLDKWYVGQSKTMLSRVHAHFSGRGCTGVYRDYQKGHPFYVQMITLKASGYASLDVLEHDLIHYYQADEYGYNVLRGNQVRSQGHDCYYRPDLLRPIVFPIKRRRVSLTQATDDTNSVSRAKKVIRPRHARVDLSTVVPHDLNEAQRYTDMMRSSHMPVDIVYVTAYGHKYHADANCRFARNRKHFVSIASEVYRVDRSLVERMGYDGCSFCCKEVVS